ncbi:hypothetical protein [Sporomusa sp.]|uniref:hypothetical protein n=1 Tax=Sporomusa sp. TaxID=2078658 RepID=UPI002C2FBC09|nr:hypothetical protein [Sporomusa sp.]HWR09442.1 hypothetical protein [Sporomusa sp.]
MYIIATYNHSLYLEVALAQLAEQGLGKDKIIAVPLHRQQISVSIFDSINDTDGVSLLGGSLAFGTATMVLATIYGFVWHWGPIVWGLIGLFAGTGFWLLASLIIMQRKQAQRITLTGRTDCGEVVLLILCDKVQAQSVKDILLNNMALAIGILER